MRLRTLGAACAVSAVAVPLTIAPSAVAQQRVVPAPAAVAGPLPATIQSAGMQLLAAKHVFFARRLHRLRGDALSLRERQGLRRSVLRLRPARLRARTRNLREDIRRLRRRLQRKLHGGAPNVPIPPQLAAIARCESGGNPRAISSGGTYRGKYQFSYATWRSVGGKGDPAAASETEQDRRAAILLRTGGPGHWPVCGR
jgi:soluble lytic murein transglycosylase-like protein